MSCIDKILTRRSIRRYKHEPVPEEALEKILEAGRQSPSAVNRQPWHFIIVTDQELKNKLGSGLFNRFIKSSAFTIVGTYNPNNPITKRWGQIDTTIAMQSMVIAAHVQGIGSCWIGDFKEAKVKETLHIPEKAKVVALISFGIPDEEPGQRKKKPKEKIFHFNRW